MIARAQRACLLILALTLGGIRAFPATPAACPIPMVKGTEWIYEGQVQWTIPNSAMVKSNAMRWVMRVTDSVVGPDARAAVVTGMPDELAWYEPGQQPRFHVLLSHGTVASADVRLVAFRPGKEIPE